MFTRSVNFFLLALCFLGTTPSFCLASAGAGEFDSPKSLIIWNHDISYHLLIENNPRLSFDGKAFIRRVDGRRVPFVTLNIAFLEKEALSLFHRFQSQSAKASPSPLPVERNAIMALEERLMELRNPSLSSLSTGTLSIQGALKKLQDSLENVAWLRTYRMSVKNASTAEEAERNFVKGFMEQRLKTLEYHEVAHIHDILTAVETQSKDFERFTEANAFYAELAYGENPHDVMAQALAGLIDEIHQGKTVDHSAEKVVSVLRFLKQCPRFARLMRPAALSKGCLETMVKANKPYFAFVGRELYRGHQNLLVSNLSN